jgi:hypothetical protein
MAEWSSSLLTAATGIWRVQFLALVSGFEPMQPQERTIVNDELDHSVMHLQPDVWLSGLAHH